MPDSRPLGDTFLHPPTCWQDELEQDFPGYEVLLQLEEDEEIGLRFYDCGTLFFLNWLATPLLKHTPDWMLFLAMKYIGKYQK